MIRTRRLIDAFIVFNVVWSILSTIVNIFPCKPISAQWDLFARVNSPKCVNLPLLASLSNSLFVISDAGMLALSAYVVWNLKLPVRTKIGVSFLFGLGIVLTVACAMKTYYFTKVYESYDSTCMYFKSGKFGSVLTACRGFNRCYDLGSD
jgi:hypothetical protein